MSDDPGASKRGASAKASANLTESLRIARTGQSEWAALGLRERARRLEAAAAAMLADRASILARVKRETGKHEVEALFTEALGHLDAVKGWRSVVEDAASRSVALNPLAFPGKKGRIDLVPRGVVGIIAPWNFPVSGLYRSLVPALLLGNAVILKPSEHSPTSSAWFAEHFAALLPRGVVQVVQGDGETGAALVRSGIDACVFTGSVETGKRVRVAAAEAGIPVSVEMGGKDAAIVLADCEMWRTVAGVTQWALANSGQACGAIEIAYVDEGIADTFVARMKDAWQRLRTGPGVPDVDVSPMANRRQFDVVAAHVADAVAKGAKVVVGGTGDADTLTWTPTLLDHCTPDMAVVRDETFGPVLAIVRVGGVDEAVRAVNRSRYGLGASIWTADVARAERLAERLDVGVVTINNHAFSGALPAMPWSGTKDTGFGVAGSTWSLATFARPKATLHDSGTDADIYWMPLDRTLGEIGEALADAQIGKFWNAWKLPLWMRARKRAIRAFFGGSKAG
ncbi:MAG: aldehyde dehydrogenase family protein [Polyangiaceae bacterium]